MHLVTLEAYKRHIIMIADPRENQSRCKMTNTDARKNEMLSPSPHSFCAQYKRENSIT